MREVDQKSLSDLVSEYDDLVDRARRRRLTEADTRGGIATVTNFGTFGLTTGTPIPLPNETLILGIGAGRKKPVWSEQVEAFLPATEAELLLTFDHRVVDGGGAGVLLNRVAALLQQPENL
jgi:pyruvate/2-oxoglutarate dehydrogenase complex dihydrolipoamide acyltransferase (E2) component